MITYILAGVVIAIAVGMFISSRDKEQNAKDKKKAETVGGANVTNDISRVYPGSVFELPAFGEQLTPIETYVKAETSTATVNRPGTNWSVTSKGESSMSNGRKRVNQSTSSPVSTMKIPL